MSEESKPTEPLENDKVEDPQPEKALTSEDKEKKEPEVLALDSDEKEEKEEPTCCADAEEIVSLKRTMSMCTGGTSDKTDTSTSEETLLQVTEPPAKEAKIEISE